MKPSSFGAGFGLLVKRRRAERGLSQNDLAAALWPMPDQPKDHPRKPDISRLESGRIANPQEKTVLALCETLGIREDEVNALRLAPPLDPYGLAKVLDNLKSASQADLYALARAFGDAEPEQRSDAALRAFLTDKAEEYANYRKLIDALDGRVAAIANLKGAAQDAAARFDFDEVETLLARVQEVELDIAAQTSEARAENALLRGRVEQAYTLYSAAADSFAALGPVEVGRRCYAYAERLKEHGKRYGGMGLPVAIELLERILVDLPWDAAPWQWAATQRSLAIACETLSQRSDDRLRSELIGRAIAAYENALQVFTRASHPLEWARTTQDLGVALRLRGERTPGCAGITLLARAASASEDALQVINRTDHPLDWAGTMQNLAGAQQVQGARTAGEAGTALLVSAVEASHAALGVFTRADHPENWAAIQENLAICHALWSRHLTSDDPAAHLRQALTHVEAALTVYDPDHMPFYHDKASRLRDEILAALAART